MTIDELVIDDRIVTRFFTNCRAHFAIGGDRPVERARIRFFADLRNALPLDDFVHRLPAIYQQLDAWEEEAQDEPLPQAA